MKTYKEKLPEITLKLKRGELLKVKIEGSRDAADTFRKVWDVDSLEIYESMICLFLNRAHNTIGWLKVSQGGISSTTIDNKLILSTALKCLASSIIIAHNHPSGSGKASESDIAITKRLQTACSTLEINLLDHIILTEEGYYSMVDEGII